MEEPPNNLPQETPGLDAYYQAALINIVLHCDHCRATLDPDQDLGPERSFHSDRYFVLLGDEAYRRGWRIAWNGSDFEIRCPVCAAR